MYYLWWGNNSVNRVLFGKHKAEFHSPKPHKSPRTVVYTSNPSTWIEDTGRSLRLAELASPAYLTSSRLARVFVSKNKVDSSRGTISKVVLCPPLSWVHMCAHLDSHTLEILGNNLFMYIKLKKRNKAFK